MAEPSSPDNDSIVGRVRSASASVRSASISVMNANPQLGMWQAAGTAIAQAPSLTELRDPDSGGDNIAFTSRGHSARYAVQEPRGDLALVRPAVVRRASTLSIDAQPGFRRNGFNNDKAEEIREAEEPSLPADTSDDVRPGTRESPPPSDGLFNDKTEKIRDPEKPSLPADTSDDVRPGTLESPPSSDGQQLRRRQSLHQRHMANEKAPWKTTVNNGLKAFWKFFLTPSGFIITIYCLNIVGWGAMLFFLLLKAAPAMNYPTADDDDSPRKKWLEIASQILNALFCVTGFGLAPWRFRDLYLYVRAVGSRNRAAMRRLAAQNKGWFRPPAWAAWATGTFIGLGCGVAMLAGLMSWWEGRKVKKIEGPEVKIVQEV
ncbi:hypothetical protein CTA1_9747 [Colletotrichum tanaceti]|uniref:Uncharacterized protein n=1 Tax=Colletotrichum tanaceti TaxID=1306861 RepID=A0A4U6XEA9_9PEZI|nr:hypothetical protein CTA1_9747 [Colletotrichum tanaceti]